MAAYHALLLGLFLLAPPVLAHDYWLQPTTFRPQVGQPFQVHLYLGDNIFNPDEERPYEKARTPALTLFARSGPQDLRPTTPDGQKPLSRLNLTEPGTYVLALDRSPSTITLANKKFNAYLKEEGLTDIQAGRAKVSGRERYSRNLKTILQVGEVVDDLPLTPLGQTLELVPQQHPATLLPQEPLTVQALFEGKALPNRQIVAVQGQGKQQTRQVARTDALGKATFRLDRSGPWVIRLVHMRSCQQDCQKIDWESYWTALSFSR
ncbi:DUF4198 domain-containing protein [Candidatus Cyanaurora vandensis]|uniref:DUF4198 domain-containing protein n=1 Tax=Candidatus Cyanaurora vandensis TaxID=2714958 RepID=UPI00257EA3CA|nr:DUF4198 domain-containing protein [Candidatus Cyanaurora vandensis]